MAQENQEKFYNSIFVPEDQIDLPNYLVEILIVNFLKIKRKPIPNFPFWRKEYCDRSTEIKELSKRYQLELIGVKQLLKTFSAEAISKDFTENFRVVYKFGKKETQSKIKESISKIDQKIKDSTKTIVSIKPIENNMAIYEDMKISTPFSRNNKKISL